ncbi:cGMP-dependent 3',5'-cyclic phosphodiesterase [Dirofilaria immitis]
MSFLKWALHALIGYSKVAMLLCCGFIPMQVIILDMASLLVIRTSLTCCFSKDSNEFEICTFMSENFHSISHCRSTVTLNMLLKMCYARLHLIYNYCSLWRLQTQQDDISVFELCFHQLFPHQNIPL